MLSHLRPAIVMLAAFTALTGIAYPLVITGVAQVVAHSPANGSIVVRNGTPVGSALIGQGFISDRYFHGRPSAAGEKGYDASASSGSNLGPLSKKLVERVTADAEALRTAGARAIPADAVTTSASGLDPDISPEFAQLQIQRVAAARKMDEAAVAAIVRRRIEQPTLGLFGQPRVNVLLLNLELDEVSSAGTR